MYPNLYLQVEKQIIYSKYGTCFTCILYRCLLKSLKNSKLFKIICNAYSDNIETTIEKSKTLFKKLKNFLNKHFE